jgi:hypothetical protein
MLYSSKNYTLGYHNGDGIIETLIWDENLLPTIVNTSDGFPLGFYNTSDEATKAHLSSCLPLVNLRACMIALDCLQDTWGEIPDLVVINGAAPSIELYEDSLTNRSIFKLLEKLEVAVYTDNSTETIDVVDWDEIYSAFYNTAEECRWLHLMIYANRYNPDSITLAPVMDREIIDTICNYYLFANTVMMACKFDPLRFTAMDFPLLRMN